MWQYIKLDASCLPGPRIPEDAEWQQLGARSAQRFCKLLQQPNPANQTVVLSWSWELRCKYTLQEICASDTWGPMHLLRPVTATRQWVLLRHLVSRVFQIEVEEMKGECTEWTVTASNLAGVSHAITVHDCSGLGWLHTQVAIAFDAGFCERPHVKLAMGTRILHRQGTFGAFMRGGKKRRCERNL